MKKFIVGNIIGVMAILSLTCGQLIVPDSENYILNENEQQVFDTENINDPLRE